MFMHFGVYSVYGGYYNGHRQAWVTPSRSRPGKTFPPTTTWPKAKDLASNFDAAAICKTVHDSGMTYLMITSKHHDGFAMWDTKTTDYNIVKQSNYGKDPMKELSTECNKLGVKLAFYFSIIDWTKQTPELRERQPHRRGTHDGHHPSPSSPSSSPTTVRSPSSGSTWAAPPPSNPSAWPSGSTSSSPTPWSTRACGTRPVTSKSAATTR